MSETTKDIPQFSTEANFAKSLLLSSSDGVNFFVEDTGHEFEYEIIFERLFGSTLKINSIVSCNGKEGVKGSIEEFSQDEYQQEHGITIFIVDGDFDNFFNTRDVYDNLLYLDYYNIECYFVDESATKKYLRKKLKLTMPVIESMVEYTKWENNFVNDFKKLFALFLIVKDKCPNIKNIDTGPHRYLNKDGRLKEEEYQKYYDSVSEYVTSSDLQNMISRIDGFCEGDYKKIFCGKYMLCSLREYLRDISGRQIGYDDFRNYTIDFFDISSLEYIKDFVYHYKEIFETQQAS